MNKGKGGGKYKFVLPVVQPKDRALANLNTQTHSYVIAIEKHNVHWSVGKSLHALGQISDFVLGLSMYRFGIKRAAMFPEKHCK